MHCANVLCNNNLPAYEFRTKLHSRWNLCSRCVEIVSQKGVPLTGFIPIDAVIQLWTFCLASAYCLRE